MATGEIPIPGIPGSLIAEVERMAREQDKTVSQVVTEAVDRYLKDEQWQRLRAYGRERAAARRLTEDDVPRLIEEARREYGQER
jgi:metal-responsive CopG/Arc/MetJ family transcriptional regulator